ncbi:MAG TPA: alpha/beta hydrolase fold domain-containing protein [Solirubrobacterales bacterium]|nr:alpha/beta hydrolase fold domain-containing protein [Solirubrobacterales bacterium]
MSFQNDLVVRLALPVLGAKRRFSDAERMRRHIARRAARPARFAPPRWLGGGLAVDLSHADGWPVYEIKPRAARPLRHLVYFHGGAYVNEIVLWHWLMLARLAARGPSRCFVPIYPLGAALGAEQTVTVATAIVRDLIDGVGAEQVVLAGDSAGGGMALAVAQALCDEGVRPRRLILIAPWLDVAIEDRRSRAIEPRDAMLGIPGLREAGRAYAKGLPLEDPRVSPIHGEMGGLPPLSTFVGSEDLLNPDSHRLREACDAAGVACELIEAPGMPHAYPVFPTPEGRAAVRQIAVCLRR